MKAIFSIVTIGILCSGCQLLTQQPVFREPKTPATYLATCKDGTSFDLALTRSGQTFTASFKYKGEDQTFAGTFSSVPGGISLWDGPQWVALGYDVYSHRILGSSELLDCILELPNSEPGN
jgi:hypothetical protein